MADSTRRLQIPNSTQVSNVLLDEMMADLTGAELKVLLYLVRRTFGFGKQSDNISINQLCNGIVTREGRQLDHGTGLSHTAVMSALKKLIERGTVVAEIRSNHQDGKLLTRYSLHLQDSGDPYEEKLHRGYEEKLHSPSTESDVPLGQKAAIQNLVKQNQVEQNWKTELAATMTASNYHRWVAPLELVELVNHHAILIAPDAGTADYARTRLADTLARALQVERIEVHTAKGNGL